MGINTDALEIGSPNKGGQDSADSSDEEKKKANKERKTLVEQ